MTNKRQIKKYVDRIGQDIAGILLPGAVYTKIITEEKANEILEKLSELKTQTFSRLNIAFDKSPKSFDSVRAYNTARRAYYKEAYNKAIKDFETQVDALIAAIKK